MFQNFRCHSTKNTVQSKTRYFRFSLCLGLREKLGGLLAVDHLVDESLRHELRIIKVDWNCKTPQHNKRKS